MKQAAALAHETMNENIGGPFGAAIVKDGEILAIEDMLPDTPKTKVFADLLKKLKIKEK